MIRKWLKTILSLAMILMLGACSSGTKPQEKEITLPDFSGLTREDVEAWRNENSVSEDRVLYAYEYSETIAQDKVISQSISAGEVLGEENLTVTISNGVDPQAEITLIDFTGMRLEEIQQWFINEHFEKVSVEYVYDPSVEVGQFLGTSAEEGKARRDEPIVIKVSGDPAQAGVAVTMPGMANWTKAQAEEWANTNQITIDYSSLKSASVPEGSVVSQNPSPDTQIIKGDHVQVVLSAGNEIDAVNLAGKSRADIETWGQQNGIQISWIQCWNSSASGTVYLNQPNSGTMRMGDIMKVYVSVGPIPVKDYTGLSYQNNFLGWLNSINEQYYSSANLKVTISEKESEKDSGIILEQYPNSGYINPGNTITLVIARHVDPQPTPQPQGTVYIPSMTGYSEFDFKHALHAYGVWEGNRTEQYSNVIAKDYILYNASGNFALGANVDYVVSLGKFTLVPQYWAGKDYQELVNYIDSANRMGANVTLDPSYIDTGDINSHNRISMVEGPLDDGTIHVRVARYLVY